MGRINVTSRIFVRLGASTSCQRCGHEVLENPTSSCNTQQHTSEVTVFALAKDKARGRDFWQ